MAGVKHSYDVSDIEQEDNATVHGVILDLSPVKTSRNNPDVKYFNAKFPMARKLHV